MDAFLEGLVMEANVLDYLQLRVLSFYHEAQMLKQGKMPRPRMCILYPTYVCNHRCFGCDYSEEHKSRKSLTREEFDHIIDELLNIGIESVEFCGGGEPTLHPYLPKALDRFISNNIAFGILTNGTNLTPDIKRKLVDHGSYCRISAEAGSKEIFDRYKKPRLETAGFDAVIGNIRDLVRLRNAQLPDTRLQLSYKYAMDKNNYKDVFKALELAHELNVDSIQFKCIRNVPSEIKDESIIEGLHRGFKEIKEKYADFRIIDNIEKSYLKKRTCWLSPFQLTVDPYGDVYICCYYRHRKEKHRLGNLLNTTLKEIWFSQEHWEKIAQIDVEDCNKYDCRFHYYNDLMYELVIEDTGQLCFI